MSLLANSNAIETGGYQISRSVRLRSSASAYLNRTPASASNRKTWTWSAWVKIGSNSDNFIFGGNPSATQRCYIGLTSSNNLDLVGVNASSTVLQLRTTAVFRDPSAWYHFVFSIDTTQATAADRAKIYINGSQITALSIATYPSQNTDLEVNNNSSHVIGVRGTYSITNLFDGYLTEINFIDGQALTPSSFGETDANTGVWVAKKYTGTYGTNGFYLNFSDNSAATAAAIGKDSSGNANNWTPNNISVTAGSTYDSMLDVPSGNGYADGGNGRGNYNVLNPLTLGTTTLSNGNLNAVLSTTTSSTHTTLGVDSGKWYWEATYTSGTNNALSVGVNQFGNITTLGGSASPLSTGGAGYYGFNGNLYSNGSVVSTGATFAPGNVLGVALDADGGTITFYKNNVSQGTATLPTKTSTWMAAFDNGTGSGTQSISVNFGQQPFSYTPPTGFKALNTTNLSEPTIKQGDDYFNAIVYTGDGVASRYITGVGFQPDFVWIKNRTVANFHQLHDAVRGATAGMLASNSTNAQDSSYPLTSFNADGFTTKSGAQDGTNNSGSAFVAWNWKANGAGVSNTAGSITSTVSANTTSGFSIVTYTGTGANATVGHGLGLAPKMVIVKNRGVTDVWMVYHTAMAATEYIILNRTDAKATLATVWNSTAPASTVFSIGTLVDVNRSTNTYVAYCFAEVPGYSAFGSYTGNGSTDGPFVFCGFRPRWILIKRSDTSSDWTLLDTARDTYNGMFKILYPNYSNSEDSTSIRLDSVSNGFKIRIDSTSSNYNASGGTYIYAAFAEVPMKFSNAR